MFENQIVGITRFSIPSTDAFSISQSTLEECEAVLFAKDRIEKRLELFERFWVPSVANQTDTNFMALVLIGENLPTQYFDHLLGLIENIPHACLAKVKPDSHFRMINKVVSDLPRIGSTHRTTFRLDDDDMVDVAYVARLRATIEQVAPLTPNAPFAVAYHKGYYLDLSTPEPVFYEMVENLPLGLALSATAPINWRSNIYAWNHRYVPKKCNTYIDVKVPSFIRTMHDANDAPRTAGLGGKEMRRADIEPVLKSSFGLEWDDLTKRAALLDVD